MADRIKQQVRVLKRLYDSGTPTVIFFGKVSRKDKDCEVHIYKYVDASETPVIIPWERVYRGFVEAKKRQKFDLEEGAKYHVVVIGDKVAGVATTAGVELEAPFSVFIDPPDEGALKFLKLSIPTGEPVLPGSALETAIKKSLN